MILFDDFIKNSAHYKHHALLLVSKHFATGGMALPHLQQLSHAFCALSFQIPGEGLLPTHPDLYIVDKERKILRLEEMEPLRERALFPPMVAQRRLFFIDRCERMNTSSANSFLKTLEEPQLESRLLFVLTTSSPDQVLSTIKSRCFKVFLRFPEEEKASPQARFEPQDWQWLAEKIGRLSGMQPFLCQSIADQVAKNIPSSTLSEVIVKSEKLAKEYGAQELRDALIYLISLEVKRSPQCLNQAKFLLKTLTDWKDYESLHPTSSLWLIKILAAL